MNHPYFNEEFIKKTKKSFDMSELKHFMSYFDILSDFYVKLYEKNQLNKDLFWKIHYFNRFFIKDQIKKIENLKKVYENENENI